VRFEAAEFNALRSEYMNPTISPGAVSLGLGILIDRKLIGCIAFSFGPSKANYDAFLPQPSAYMLSDFSVAPTKYLRLSKLVLMCSLSNEVKRVVERYSKRRANSLRTTAFTNKHESMKYRGIYKKMKKKETTEGDFKFMINYGQVFSGLSLLESLAEWRKRFVE